MGEVGCWDAWVRAHVGGSVSGDSGDRGVDLPAIALAALAMGAGLWAVGDFLRDNCRWLVWRWGEGERRAGSERDWGISGGGGRGA